MEIDEHLNLNRLQLYYQSGVMDQCYIYVLHNLQSCSPKLESYFKKDR